MLALALTLALTAAQGPGPSPQDARPPGMGERAPSPPSWPRFAGQGAAGGEQAGRSAALQSAPPAPGTAEAQPASGAAEARLLAGALVDAEGRPLSRARFAELAEAADFLVVGESHGNRCDHGVEASLIDALAELGLEPTIGLEMISVDQRQSLALFNQGRVPVAELGPAVGWSWSWAFDYGLYAPLFEAARRNHCAVAALNVPSYVAWRVLEGVEPGQIHPRGLLPEQILLPLPEQEPSLRAAFEEHQRLQCIPESEREDDEEAWERFVLVQSIRDSMMAEQAIEAGLEHGGPVLVLAGEDHVEHGWGIPYRLSAFAPKARILTLMPWRGGTPPGTGAADLYYFCPSAR